MKIRRVVLLAVLAAALGACTRAPDEAALKSDLRDLIEANYAPGLFDVDAARRANDFPFVWPAEHVRVGFDATLRLNRDHRFGAWDQINVGVLALLLDAAPQDIEGVKPAGNSAGDIVAVRGRLPYLAIDGKLTRDTTAPVAAPERERGLVLVSDLEEAVTRGIRGIKEAMRASKVGLALAERNLARRAFAGHSARRDGGFAVATDTKDTIYWRLGRAAERAALDRSIPFANVAADTRQEALDFLRAGHVSAVVLRNTEAALAAAAEAPFDAGGSFRLAALAALYPEPVHVIVRGDSPLGSPAELFGKHVGVAGRARVDTLEAEAILRGHGVPVASLAAPLMAVPAAEALDQLEAGAFDALIMTAALPSPELSRFAARRPLRLLPFDGDAIAYLTSGAASYVAITLPARTYPGQARPLAAVAALAMLISVDGVPAEEAMGLATLMLTRVDYLGLGSLTGAMISRDEAGRPMTLSWHPGAERFFGSPANE